MKTAVEQRRPSKSDNAALREAIRLAQQGDAEAFEFLYRLHCRRVYALCLRMLRDPVEAEDLTQEAFMQLFRKIHTFRGESAFSTWLHRLTANLVLMRLRKKKLISTSLENINATDEEHVGHRWEFSAPDVRLTGLFDRVNLETAIDRLPEGYKTMFVLHDVEGYDHNEICQILECSIGTSKSQLHRARTRLRKLLHGLQRRIAPQDQERAGGSLAINGCRINYNSREAA